MEFEILELENEYMKMFKDEINIFPQYWFEINDLDKKLEVLTLAIKEKKHIADVKGGSYFVEGIDN